MNKWFGKLHVLQDVDLEVARGEVLVVCGPSGSGKSTLIRCVNRLEQIQSGRLIVDGLDVQGPDVDLRGSAPTSAWSSSSSTSTRT